MSLVIVKGLSLSYGARSLFDNQSFTIGPSDRIGLVGANGTGKSTLLKVLMGLIKPDSGELVLRRKARIGYLPQDLVHAGDGSVLDNVMRAVPGRDALSERLLVTEAALAEARDEAEQLELAGSLAELHEELDHFDEHYGAHRAERILTGLGFEAAGVAQPLSTFSGGWRMRAALAGLLLQDPDLLLLDEPTNHLDLPTLTWLDAFLRRNNKARVLICHDRSFLDRQVNRIVSLEIEGIKSWPGNYEAYQKARAVEAEVLMKAAVKQELQREHLKKFIERFRYKASKARQVQSRIKQLDKVQSVQTLEERDVVSFRFPEVASSGREVVTFKGVSFSYGPAKIYDGLDATLLRGQRVAVVGLNGAGKTTLLKLLSGELAPSAGEIKLGHGVVPGYYAQHHADTLDASSTILDEIWKLAPDKAQSWVRSVLGSFLFSGDDVEKKIGVLSGGEKARVALARLLVKPANLLVMDEPTNHLDLDSSEALIDALEGYGGTLIFVTHNRSFLDRLATHVWDVRDRRVVPFPGNLAEYLEHLELENARAERPVGAAAATGPALPAKDRKRLEAEARQAKSTKTAPLKKEIATLELRIAELEKAQKEREGQLVDPDFARDFARAKPVMDAHRDAAEELDAALARWEAAQKELEAALS
ncbi:MAG: ABC-F family ATP-binding cassette domain-containing protein [Myxococcaceae bacterium]|nr:ABC-F family ATP-binding cassette domain-containing protein [Myxococcaceae bacterium]